METIALALPGCYVLKARHVVDGRGDFFKPFDARALAAAGLACEVAESYVTCSQRGVVRGLHFQAPPADHVKLVSCLSGRARDALLDLRRDSPGFGRVVTVDLAAGDGRVVHVARGVAHGFAAWQDDTRMLYFVSSAHDPARDCGVRWNSVGIDWWPPGLAPRAAQVSPRDAALPAWDEFDSPFRGGAGA